MNSISIDLLKKLAEKYIEDSGNFISEWDETFYNDGIRLIYDTDTQKAQQVTSIIAMVVNDFITNIEKGYVIP